MAHHLSVALFLAVLLGQSAPPELELKSPIGFAIRVYERAGSSQVAWMGITPPAEKAVKLTELEGMKCAASQRGTTAEPRARFESAIGSRHLLTPSADGAMVAYVDRDPTVSPPVPNHWGCTDCFFPLLKIARASNAQVLNTIRLPQFGDRWNYATAIAWSPDGQTLLVGSEAGSSDSQFEDYWLLDLATTKWRYAGGGNAAHWSPGSTQILWTTPRTLEPLGNIHVWVVHLVLLDVRTLKQTAVTAGTSFVSEFGWCPTH